MMTQIVVRAAEDIDKNIIIEMLQSLQDYEHTLHPGRRPGADVAEFRYKRITDAAESFDGAVLVAIEKSEIVGLTAGWMVIDEDQLQDMEHREHGYISVLFVSPEHRGKNIAQTLLVSIEKHLVSVGASRLSIDTLAKNGPAITASRAVGFEPFEVKLEKFIKNYSP
jgi:ribosomal protein S18 acetylase RimI-like enzyme